MDSNLTGLLKAEAKASYDAYLGDADALERFIKEYSIDWQQQMRLHQINNNRYRRTRTLLQRVGDIVINGEAVFLTLTFTDDTFAKTSVETRRRYVARFLKATCLEYVANIDYGAKNGREHYHAIVMPNGKSVDLTAWKKYGSINAKRVRSTVADAKRTTKYITKLTSHAIKESTGHAYRIIYAKH